MRDLKPPTDPIEFSQWMKEGIDQREDETKEFREVTSAIVIAVIMSDLDSLPTPVVKALIKFYNTMNKWNGVK